MKTSVKELCKAGVFAAIIFVVTAYLHIPSHTGYTHVGDAFIYLAACFLSPPYAIAAGVIGAALADSLSGYAIWVPATVVIKGLTAACFSKSEQVLTKRNGFALVLADAICIGGYYLYDAILCGNFSVPLLGVPGYITQCVLSNGLFLVVGLIFYRQKKRASK